MLEPSWVGRRVSVRRVVERRADGSLAFGDVVGDLVGLDAETAVVEARRGPVEVPRALVAVAKLVVPSTADELALEEIAARGWRAAETERLGGWLLRADHGFTRRANTVLPLRAPGVPLDEALGRATDWYAQRGLPVQFSVPTEARRLLDAELGERGWEVGGENLVMARRIDLGPAAAATGVLLSGEPGPAWFARYRDGAGSVDTAQALLRRHDGPIAFARIERDGETVAIGRGVVDDGWLGVTAVEVDPALRRTGLATRVTTALETWGRDRGAVRAYLQVDAASTGAVALYERLGYHRHHEYRYRTPPQPTPLG